MMNPKMNKSVFRTALEFDGGGVAIGGKGGGIAGGNAEAGKGGGKFPPTDSGESGVPSGSCGWLMDLRELTPLGRETQACRSKGRIEFIPTSRNSLPVSAMQIR